eukprot:6200975-Pleurochrysis_carterae.AAC.1
MACIPTTQHKLLLHESRWAVRQDIPRRVYSEFAVQEVRLRSEDIFKVKGVAYHPILLLPLGRSSARVLKKAPKTGTWPCWQPSASSTAWVLSVRVIAPVLCTGPFSLRSVECATSRCAPLELAAHAIRSQIL